MMRTAKILALSFIALLFSLLARSSQIFTDLTRYNNVYVASGSGIFRYGTPDYLAYCAHQILEHSGTKDWDIYIYNVGWPPSDLIHITAPFYVVYDTAFSYEGVDILEKPRKTIIISRHTMHINIAECLKVVSYCISHVNDTTSSILRKRYQYSSVACDSCPQYLIRPDTLPAIDNRVAQLLATKKIYPCFWYYANDKAGIDLYFQDNKYHFYKPDKKPLTSKRSHFDTPVYKEYSGQDILVTNDLYQTYNYNDSDMLIFETADRFYHVDLKELSVKGPFERNIFRYAKHSEKPQKNELLFYDFIGYNPYDFKVSSVYDKWTGTVKTDYIAQVWRWFSINYVLPFLQAKIGMSEQQHKESNKAAGYSLMAMLALNTFWIILSNKRIR